ncbi:hypothetical protein BHM03_00052788 [Ensete ventricosum]|nr:hypothetical protein BHM03_00052788 [Ensete ventricosum]
MRLKRLLSLGIGRRSRGQANADENASPVRDNKPIHHLFDGEPPCKTTWRCFSYEEIHRATGGFRQGLLAPCFTALLHGKLRRILIIFNLVVVLVALEFAENLVGGGGHAEVYRVLGKEEQ